MAEVSPLRPGDPARAGRYLLRGRLGEGGQGVVYLGESPAGERVAVKLLRARTGGAWAERARGGLAGEVAAARRVDPFCTARVLDADLDGDEPYVVSEFIPGPSLQEAVESEGPRGGTALNRLAIGTATALTAIHRAGVVHRDFKPANVILGPDGPRVIDFGVAREFGAATAATSQTVGTPAYIAPERLAGRPATPATDVFAWGATMVFAATGRPPFGEHDIPAVINQILNGEPDLGPPPADRCATDTGQAGARSSGAEPADARPTSAGLGGTLRELVAGSLRKDPEARPTAEQLLLLLLGPAGPPGPPGPAGPGGSVVLAEGHSLATPTGAVPPAGQEVPTTTATVAAIGTPAAVETPATAGAPAAGSPPLPAAAAGSRGDRPGGAYAAGAGGFRRALTPLAAVLAVAFVAGLGTAAWAVLRRERAIASVPASAGALPAEAEAAVAAGRRNLPVVLNYGYRTYDADLARGRTVLSDRFRRPYDTFGAALRPNIMRDRTGRTVTVVDAGVVAARPGRVTIMVFTTEVTTREAAPAARATNPGRLKVTLVEQRGRWLVDGVSPL